MANFACYIWRFHNSFYAEEKLLDLAFDWSLESPSIPQGNRIGFPQVDEKFQTGKKDQMISCSRTRCLGLCHSLR